MSKFPNTYYFEEALRTVDRMTLRDMEELDRRLNADLPAGLVSAKKLCEVELRVRRMSEHDSTEFDLHRVAKLKKARKHHAMWRKG